MAIIATSETVTLDALDEEVIYGPEMSMSDTDALIVQAFTATTSTWTITFYGSVDGVNYVTFSVTPFSGSFGNNFSASGTSYSNIFTAGHSNIPYIKVKMTSYTGGNVTLKAVSRRVFTR